MRPFASATPPSPDHDDPLGASRQLVLVVANEWQSTAATWRRFARATTGQAWSAVGPPVAVSLGRHGLAWGRGLHGHPDQHPALAKREGDGRSPAGVFRLSAVFGDALALPAIAGQARLPYWPVTASLKCVDDPASPYYNQFVDTRQGVDIAGWSCEEMLRDDGQYAVGVVVAHNAAPPVAGAGSCIFMHVWRAPGAPTSGCTAAAVDDLVTLFSWLDERCQPVLVQLPADEYALLRERWRLP